MILILNVALTLIEVSLKNILKYKNFLNFKLNNLYKLKIFLKKKNNIFFVFDLGLYLIIPINL